MGYGFDIPFVWLNDVQWVWTKTWNGTAMDGISTTVALDSNNNGIQYPSPNDETVLVSNGESNGFQYTFGPGNGQYAQATLLVSTDILISRCSSVDYDTNKINLDVNPANSATSGAAIASADKAYLAALSLKFVSYNNSSGSYTDGGNKVGAESANATGAFWGWLNSASQKNSPQGSYFRLTFQRMTVSEYRAAFNGFNY